MAIQPTSVPNIPLQVAAALRYINANGDPVTDLLPNDYLSLTGSATGNLVTTYQQVNQILVTYATTLTSLQAQITSIVTSGATAIPQVNGQCLNGSTVANVDVVTSLLVGNTCQYNAILGTPTALAQAVLAENSAILNTLPAFSQNSAMAGLVGWVTSPTTIADADKNQWIAYLDARAGITTALAAVTPTCAQVIINYQVTHPALNTFNLFFNGYSFIPTGYTNNGSSVQITDGSGGIYTSTFDIVSRANTSGPLVLNTSGSTLSTSASTYYVQVSSNVHNTSLGITCEKILTQTTSSSSSMNGSTPDIGNFTFAVTSGATFTLTNTLSYTPRFIGLIPKTSYTGYAMVNYVYYITYTSNGANITFEGIINGGTLNIDWIAYR